MYRREFVLAALAAATVRSAEAADDVVQLLLIRDSADPSACSAVKFIPGNLFGVPANRNLMEVTSPIGLQLISRTEELPYELNTPKVSSVAPGTYSAAIRNDKTKDWMTNENRSWRLELMNTRPRTAIQFHYGKDFHWSRGCIILTGNKGSEPICQEGSNSPEEAVAKLRDYVTTGHSSTTKILIRILFAGH